jgi:hypothetical protein
LRTTGELHGSTENSSSSASPSPRPRSHATCRNALRILPTASLRVLYCWFVIHHERRRVLHFNATSNPSATRVIQQLREAFPYDTAPRYLIFDRDSIFSKAVVGFVKLKYLLSI